MRRLGLSGHARRTLVLLFVLAFSCTGIVAAQRPNEGRPAALVRQTSHSTAPQAAPTPPDLGTLLRSGWVQIVRFESPAGAKIEIASSSGVVELTVPGQVGLALGRDYRLRVSNIPEKAGLELFPTVRLIGYLVPPAHVNPLDYPIPLHFLAEDFDEATLGRLVRDGRGARSCRGPGRPRLREDPRAARPRRR